MSTVGKRIEEFAVLKFGGVRSLNKKLTQMTGKNTSIYKYVKDERSPGASILSPLAQLGCNLNWLLTGHGEMMYQAKNPQAEAELQVEKVRLDAQVGILKQIIANFMTKES